MKIVIGSDHAGFGLKETLKSLLFTLEHQVHDVGPFNGDSVDYPDYAHPVAIAVEGGDAAFGILICGSANGVAMTANKHQGIRAAVAWNKEIAALARQHNNANIICIPARFLTPVQAEEILATFLSTSFEGGRHETRVKKISC